MKVSTKSGQAQSGIINADRGAAQHGVRFARMRRFTLLMFALVAAHICVSAYAAADCADANGRSELLLCADRVYRSADAELNRVYQRVLKGQPSLRPLLIEAQRAWVRFKEADCAVKEEIYRDGSGRDALVLGCKTEHTRRRIKDLNGLL